MKSSMIMGRMWGTSRGTTLAFFRMERSPLLATSATPAFAVLAFFSRSASSFSRSMISRMGRYAAATHRFLRSLPEYPSVSFASSSKSNASFSSSLPRMTWRIFWRLTASGRSTMRRRGRRLTTASSRSKGRLVAARTSTRSFSLVRRPSQLAMNSFLILRIASCSPALSLRPSMESTSSMKTTAGAVLLARLNTARIYFSPSPNHLLATLDMDTLMKFAPASVATALASMVLPVPGGPKRRMPRQGLARFPRLKSSGLCSGNITISLKVSFT
mmetsp:Transcript_5777/g.10013  ORF Transcript_5777/g.10013 Transcript_5777/m.10013 type:complete len:273 (-) Transcript_5777:778-1596(-)